MSQPVAIPLPARDNTQRLDEICARIRDTLHRMQREFPKMDGLFDLHQAMTALTTAMAPGKEQKDFAPDKRGLWTAPNPEMYLQFFLESLQSRRRDLVWLIHLWSVYAQYSESFILYYQSRGGGAAGCGEVKY